MRKNRFSILFVLLLSGIFISPALADDDTTEITAGLRTSLGAHDSGEKVQWIEAVGTYQLPWGARFSSDVTLGTYLEGCFGIFYGAGDYAATLGIGPGVDLALLGGKLQFNLGVDAIGMTSHAFGDLDLGSALQFASYIGIRYEIFNHFVLGYRFSHLSNAGISSPNPGLNLHIVALSYRF